MKTLRNIILFVLVASISAGIGSYASIKMSDKDRSIGCINSMLYDLNVEVDLFEHWKSKYEDDQILEEKIKHLILNKVIAMRAIKPDINDLKGVPLEALQRLIALSKENSLSIKKDGINSIAVNDYLSSIEKGVIDISNKRKEAQKNILK